MILGFLIYFAISFCTGLFVAWVTPRVGGDSHPDSLLCAIAGLAWFVTLPIVALTVLIAVAALCMRAVAWLREETPQGPRLAQLADELESLAKAET